MTSYIPKHVHGHPWPAHLRPPKPPKARRRRKKEAPADIELTPKGFAYCAEHGKGIAMTATPDPLPDINLRELFGKDAYEALHPETKNGVIGATARHAPAKLADASFTADTAAKTGVLFLTVTAGDRLSIATTIERLIDMLDAMDPDPDLEETGDAEPSNGWPNGGQMARREMTDDRELDDADMEDGGEREDDEREDDHAEWDAPGFIWGGNEEGAPTC